MGPEFFERLSATRPTPQVILNPNPMAWFTGGFGGVVFFPYDRGFKATLKEYGGFCEYFWGYGWVFGWFGGCSIFVAYAR